MKSIKLLVAALALGAMTFVPALSAQVKSEDKGKAHEKQIEKIGQAVGGLTAYQKFKINVILTTAQDQVQALSQGERRTKGEEIRKASMTEVRKNLTPAQQQKFDAIPKGDKAPTP